MQIGMNNLVLVRLDNGLGKDGNVCDGDCFSVFSCAYFILFI